MAILVNLNKVQHDGSLTPILVNLDKVYLIRPCTVPDQDQNAVEGAELIFGAIKFQRITNHQNKPEGH